MATPWGKQTVQIMPPERGRGLRAHCVDQKARLRWRLRPNGTTVRDRVMWVGDWVLSPTDRIINSNGMIYKLPEEC